MDKQKAKGIQIQLDKETGTSTYWKHFMDGILTYGAVYTDGIKLMAELCEAYWLIDIPFSYQLKKEVIQIQKQVWILKVNEDDTAVITMTDTEGNEIVRQEIPYTDFPLESIKMYLVRNILALPSED